MIRHCNFQQKCHTMTDVLWYFIIHKPMVHNSLHVIHCTWQTSQNISKTFLGLIQEKLIFWIVFNGRKALRVSVFRNWLIKMKWPIESRIKPKTLTNARNSLRWSVALIKSGLSSSTRLVSKQTIKVNDALVLNLGSKSNAHQCLTPIAGGHRKLTHLISDSGISRCCFAGRENREMTIRKFSDSFGS